MIPNQEFTNTIRVKIGLLARVLFGISIAVIIISMATLITSKPKTNLVSALITQPATHTITVTKTPEPTSTRKPTDTQKLTNTDRPTNTIRPTSTEQPSQTPKPSRTPSATHLPTPTPNYVALMQVEINAKETKTAIEIERIKKNNEVTRELFRFAALVCLIPLGIILSGGAINIVMSMDWSEIIESFRQPEVEQTIRLETKIANTTHRHKWNIDPRILRLWAQTALAGGALGINAWTGKKKRATWFKRETSNSERDYELFLKYWINSGVLRRKNPDVHNSPLEVTEIGDVILQAIVDGEYPNIPHPDTMQTQNHNQVHT